ncbi:MAG: molybdopterin molybdotransferase MoeA [Candidatus Bathyarchaeia archaeon]
MKEVKARGFSEQTSVEEALRKYLKEVKIEVLQAEKTHITEALGRVLAEDVVSETDIPHFDRSAVDGYAVRSHDTFGASPTNPIVFDIVGAVEVGQTPAVIVDGQKAARVATGAPIPKGADSVVMLEYTEIIGDNKIEIYRPTTPGENVSQKGEDVKKGEKVLSKGTVLQPQDIAILAAIGKVDVKVVRKPRVAILSTGNELVEPKHEVAMSKTIDSNRFFLFAAVKDAGGEPLDLGIAKDDITEIKSRISEGLAKADLVLVSGGTSVGERDLAPEVVNSLGKPGVVIHGIAMRPGKPTALAAVNGKPVILLPGYPVSNMMAFNTFAKPLISKMLGTSVGKPPGHVVKAVMARRVLSSPGVRDFVRVIVKKMDEGYVADLVRTRGAGIISSMVKANGLVVIPEEKEGIEEGEEVEVILLRTLEE